MYYKHETTPMYRWHNNGCKSMINLTDYDETLRELVKDPLVTRHYECNQFPRSTKLIFGVK